MVPGSEVRGTMTMMSHTAHDAIDGNRQALSTRVDSHTLCNYPIHSPVQVGIHER
jgi:hypothetical protein